MADQSMQGQRPGETTQQQVEAAFERVSPWPNRIRRFGAALIPIGALIILIIAWQVWVTVADIKSFLLPPPSDVAHQLVESWSSTLAGDTWITVQEIFWGFILGALCGFILAIGIAYSRFLERLLYPPIIASQAIPKLAIAPLFVVWLGFGILPKIVVAITMVFFPVVITTAQGLMSVDKSLLELLHSVSAKPLQIFRKVTLPHALPSIMSGMKIGITLAVIGAVVGEWVGASSGLGYRILYAQSQLETALTFAAIVVLIVIGVVLFLVIDLVGRLLTPWSNDSRQVTATM